MFQIIAGSNTNKLAVDYALLIYIQQLIMEEQQRQLMWRSFEDLIVLSYVHSVIKEMFRVSPKKW
jgi:hypothetical protein